MIKNYFRILKKTHAHLQTILKTPVKFQKDRTETVGGVKGTKYPLKTRNHAPRTTRHAPRTTPHGKPKTVSLHFSSKRRGTKNKKNKQTKNKTKQQQNNNNKQKKKKKKKKKKKHKKKNNTNHRKSAGDQLIFLFVAVN